MAQWVACHAWRLWNRVLNTAPWLAQAIAIVTFALVLCQPVLLTPLLATAVAIHLLSFFSLRSFLSPHRIAQRRPVEPTSALDPPMASEPFRVSAGQGQGCPDVPGISIIKPLSGTNDTLLENLESCFQLTYPRFELLFCLHDADDPAVPVVEELMARYPTVDARLLLGEKKLEGASPKVRNMAKGYDCAKYDIFWAMDAKLRTSDHDAKTMVAQLLEPSVGLVHQLPWTRDGTDAGALLERMFFAGEHARAYCLVNGLGLPGTNGMSLMCKRASWSAIGGCEALSVTVAEDSLVGILMQAAGYSCVMAATPCVQNAPPVTLRSIIARRARWYQLKVFEMDGGRWVAPFEFWLEHASTLCLATAKLCYSTTSIAAVVGGCLAALALCAALDLTYARTIDAATKSSLGELPSRTLKDYVLKIPVLWLLNLVVPFAVICRGLATSTIVWDCNGTLKPMHPQPYSAKSSEHTIPGVLGAGWGKSTEKNREMDRS